VTDPERARRWTGLRQDSGDPFVFAPRVVEVYRSLGINPQQKRLVYSDSLSVDKALQLKKQTKELGLENGMCLSCSVFMLYSQKTIVSFGIGTFLTNDFKKASSGGTEKSKALNMVIKLASLDGHPCIKISDDLTKVNFQVPPRVHPHKFTIGFKNTGDKATVDRVKCIYNLPVSD
jgi:nicotinate phosphoribosyltransferase